ncbi:uncharacterized protein LOC142329589 [Lycorma delicatula]|uniref:uncharacterized protein LOC142329589 n=1 Tax=Lycorma delicatula TaxID=130591 RepID=UPI003F515749
MLIKFSQILIAVVYLATCYHCSMPFRTPRTRRQAGNATTDTSSSDWLPESEEVSTEASSRWLNHRESQMLLRKEGGEEGLSVDCCPSILEMIEPEGGINRDGLLVNLYSVPNSRQRFFELSCRVGVEGKPCRFMDRHLHNQSRCEQKFSYTYAIVRGADQTADGHQRNHEFTSFSNGGSTWSLDYIKIRSGCSCVVYPRTKRRRSKSKRGKE